jgi:hypothetical protein
MSGAQGKSRQKKLEKHKKKREQARALARQRDGGLPSSASGLAKLARSGAFGPVWISDALFEDDASPALITVVVTRRLAGGLLLPEVVLVDRTCLGIKNAFVMPPTTEFELGARVAEMSERSDSLRPCEPLLAQSVVFHALDYAASLGFGPQADFEPALFEPRPAVLLDTPLAKPERPNYISGPDDDVPRILRQLAAASGPEGHLFSSAGALPADDVLEGVHLARSTGGAKR